MDGSRVKTDICKRCMTWHELPECNHNSEAKCTQCNLPVGYLWTGDLPANPGVCWYCTSAIRSLGTGSLATRDGDARRGDATFVVRGVKPMVLDQVRREKTGIEGRLCVGLEEARVRFGPDGYTGRIIVEGYPMVVVIDHRTWNVRFLN